MKEQWEKIMGAREEEEEKENIMRIGAVSCGGNYIPLLHFHGNGLAFSGTGSTPVGSRNGVRIHLPIAVCACVYVCVCVCVCVCVYSSTM
mmetsp:Transcript_5789/g.7697  ORF Transcript_5789/g.7697 Transcript_5789/m.7697 type:complete len:90 (+) Transcript_5789:1148-1417(+)